MSALDKKDLHARAEEVLRQAGGDVESALAQFRAWLDSNTEARSWILERTARLELEAAFERLEHQQKKCPYCAELISVDAIKCRHCGEWLERPAAPPASVRPRVWYFVLFTAWLLILLVVALAYTFSG